MSCREECGTGNVMEKTAWNKEWHAGNDSEQRMAVRENVGARNFMK
jgi:hypothetical protein